MLINNAVLEEAGLTPDDVDTSDWAGLSDVATRRRSWTVRRSPASGSTRRSPSPTAVGKANGATCSARTEPRHLDDPAVVESLEYTVSLIEAQGGGVVQVLPRLVGLLRCREPFASNQPARSRWRTGTSTS